MARFAIFGTLTLVGISFMAAKRKQIPAKLMATAIATLLPVIRVLTPLSKRRYCLTVIVKALSGVVDILKNADVAKDSSNSSQPPGSDSVKKGRKSLKKTGKPLGGQEGHDGATHLYEGEVTHREEVTKDVEKYRNNPLWIQLKATRRQILDVKLERVVVEYISREFRNIETGETVSGEFPDGVNAGVQFGLNLRTFVVFLRDHEHIPYRRLAALIFGLFDLKIGESTLVNIVREAETSETVQLFKKAAAMEIRQSEVVRADESTLKVADPDPAKTGSKNSWPHFLVSRLFVPVTLGRSGGKEGTDDASGLLENFMGFSVHGCRQIYFKSGLHPLPLQRPHTEAPSACRRDGSETGLRHGGAPVGHKRPREVFRRCFASFSAGGVRRAVQGDHRPGA
jgi:hypothetical protein